MDLNNICKFWSLIKTHHLLVCNIINMMPYNGCSQMLHVSLKTEKYFIAHAWRLLCVVGLEEYSAHDWRAPTSGTARSSYLARVGPVAPHICWFPYARWEVTSWTAKQCSLVIPSWFSQPSIRQLGLSTMLIVSGGHLWKHWFGLEVGYKMACKTIEFYWDSNNKAS